MVSIHLSKINDLIHKNKKNKTKCIFYLLNNNSMIIIPIIIDFVATYYIPSHIWVSIMLCVSIRIHKRLEDMASSKRLLNSTCDESECALWHCARCSVSHNLKPTYCDTASTFRWENKEPSTSNPNCSQNSPHSQAITSEDSIFSSLGIIYFEFEFDIIVIKNKLNKNF